MPTLRALSAKLTPYDLARARLSTAPGASVSHETTRGCTEPLTLPSVEPAPSHTEAELAAMRDRARAELVAIAAIMRRGEL